MSWSTLVHNPSYICPTPQGYLYWGAVLPPTLADFRGLWTGEDLLTVQEYMQAWLDYVPPKPRPPPKLKDATAMSTHTIIQFYTAIAGAPTLGRPATSRTHPPAAEKPKASDASSVVEQSEGSPPPPPPPLTERKQPQRRDMCSLPTPLGRATGHITCSQRQIPWICDTTPPRPQAKRPRVPQPPAQPNGAAHLMGCLGSSGLSLGGPRRPSTDVRASQYPPPLSVPRMPWRRANPTLVLVGCQMHCLPGSAASPTPVCR